MSKRCLPACCCLFVMAVAGWFGGAAQDAKKPSAWIEVAPGVLRTPGLPAGYALVDGANALLIDAPQDATGLKEKGVSKIEAVLLTHHHWDTCAAAGRFLKEKVPVRAPQKSAEWLTPEGVRKHWLESLPLRNSRAAYLVAPTGLEGIDCSLQDQQQIDWHDWTIQVVATPGHSRDHVAFSARKGKESGTIIFCGDALASTGKLWTPFTTDWNHWTDEGLAPAAESLRKLAALKPALLLPAHGPAIAKDADKVLTDTAAVIKEVGFLKSFERYTKERLGNAPQYGFLAKQQVATSGKEPWTRISPHLFLTGNTYVLTSKDNAFMVIDPWGKLSAEQIAKLKDEQKLGDLEVVMFSHAHFDHYDGIYHLPDREKFRVWTLDRVATPIADPFLLRAPFLDARPVKIDRQLKDGENAAWREYRFLFHHFPGQTEFSMGVQTTIDGKKCFFTADNFFHQDQFSGSGGWMGLNRSYPLPYSASAQQVLGAAPDWVLAEHGGAFEFNAEDFRRRVRWGQAAAASADVVSPNGQHVHDWDPHRVHVEPVVQKARPGAAIQAKVVAGNVLARPQKLTITLLGRDQFADQTLTLDVPARGTVRRDIGFRLPEQVEAGRQVFVLRVAEEDAPQGTDAFLVVDVEK